MLWVSAYPLIMLTRLQRILPAIFAFALLCLLPVPVWAHSRQAMARPVPHLRAMAAVNKAHRPEAASRRGRGAARVERASSRKEMRVTKTVRGRKPVRALANVPKRRERDHVRRAELVKTVAHRRTDVPAAAKRDGATAEIRGQYLTRREESGQLQTPERLSNTQPSVPQDDPADPMPVVNLIRPTTERPQLPDPQEVAAMPEILPSLRSPLYDERGRLVIPAALKGSHEILIHQNEMADRDGLARVQDDGDLEEMRRRAMLVAVPVGGGLQVDERLPGSRRYCRPWTANFLAVLARAHYARFHTALQVNSAVRTMAIQQRLLRTNGNAAPVAGETASPHLTGQAVDIGKRGMPLVEIAWLRGYLLPLIEAGKIDVEEEFQQSCFHISVYRKYAPQGPLPEGIAVTHRDRPAALAIMLH